jgi:thiol-disulfide isomerase/thioredoxin
MPPRTRYAVLGVLAALVVGGFLWRYGDTTDPVDPTTSAGQDLVRGWRDVDDRELPAISQELPGIAGAADGLPSHGTYLVNLWASNCGPCRHEMPWLQQLQDEGAVSVVGVTRDNILANAERFLRRRDVSYPNVRDEYGDFMAAIGDVVPPALLPSSLLVEDGRITWARVGPFDSYEDLRDSVSQRL